MTVRNVSQGNNSQYNPSIPKETQIDKNDDSLEIVEVVESTPKEGVPKDINVTDSVINEAQYVVQTIDELSEIYKADFDNQLAYSTNQMAQYNEKSFDYTSIDSGNELSDLTGKKDGLERNISQCYNDINSAYNGTTDELKEYRDAYVNAQLNYERVLDESTNPAVIAIKDEINQANENLALQKTIVDFYTTQISQTNFAISQQNTNLEGIKSEINSYNTQESSLKSAIASCTNEEQKLKLQSRLSSLQALIGNTQSRQVSQESIIKTLKEKLVQLESEQPGAQKIYEDYEQKKTELEQNLLDTKDETILSALNDFNSAKETFEMQQNELIVSLNIYLSDLQTQLRATQEDIISLKEELFAQQMEEEKSLKTQDLPDEITPISYQDALNYSAPSADGLNSVASSAIQEVAPQNLEEDSKKAQEELKENKEARNNVLLGKDEDLSALKKLNSDNFNELYNALKAQNPSLAAEIFTLQDDLTSKESEIDSLDFQIFEYEDELNSLKQQLSGVTITLSALNSQLETLEKTDTSKFDSEKLEKFEQNKAALEAEISSQESLKETFEKEIEEMEQGEKYEEYVALKQKRTEAKKEYDKIYDNLQSKLNKAKSLYPDLESDINKFKESHSDYTAKKADKLDDLNGKVKTSQAKADELYKTSQTSIAADKAIGFRFANGDGQAIIDYAKTFLGCNESDGSANKFVNGASSAQIPWCAAFVSYVMKNSPESSEVASWYNNIGNKWSCGNVYNAAKDSNALISANEVQPGDMVLFDWQSDGIKDHVGIVTSIDSDGTVHTIEGNTSNTVAERTYNPNKTNMVFCKTFG